jgi:peptide/nickel transport system permease protein
MTPTTAPGPKRKRPPILPDALRALEEPAPPVQATATLSQWQLIARNFARHRLAVHSLHVLVILYFIAIFAEFVSPCRPDAYDLDHPYCPPQLLRWSLEHGLHVRAMVQTTDPITLRRTYEEHAQNVVGIRLLARTDAYHLAGAIPMQRRLLGVREQPPGAGATAATFHLLGADKYGRDILSRIAHGARISLSVGIIGIVVTFVLGALIGGISGYAGGRTDNLIQRAIEIVNAFPHLPLWLALAAVMPDDWSPLRVYFAITVVLSLLGWTGLARVVRGKILSLREEDYVTAARLVGASHSRILLRHLIPGFTSHIIVALSLSVPGMILGETSLSFLGLGLRPPIVSWGVMLQDCMDIQAVRYYPWLMFPVFFIVSTVLAFNFIGDGLRDAADPYTTA